MAPRNIRRIRCALARAGRCTPFVVCLLAGERSAHAITGARDASNKEFAGVGAIVARRPSCGDQVVCTGALVAPDAILTAAHCGDVMVEPDLGDPTFYVVFDTDPQVSVSAYETCPPDRIEGELHPIARYSVHSQYVGFLQTEGDLDRLIGMHDIAIWHLQEPVEEIEPIPVLLEAGRLELEVEAGDIEFWMVGYGPDLQTGPKRRIAATSMVESAASELRYDGPAQRCKGDSGGPTLIVSPRLDHPAIVSLASRIHRLDIAQSPCGSIIETRIDAHAEFVVAEAPRAAAPLDVDTTSSGGDAIEPSTDGGGCSITSRSSWVVLWLPLLALALPRRPQVLRRIT